MQNQNLYLLHGYNGEVSKGLDINKYVSELNV